MTVKSRLRVIQGHCKRNHWIDHTRLGSRRAIWRWLLSWPCRLEVTQGHWKWYQLKAWKLGYGFVFHSNYSRIFSHFGDIQRQRMAWPWNLSLGSFKVLILNLFLYLLLRIIYLLHHTNYNLLRMFYSSLTALIIHPFLYLFLISP